MMRLYFNTVALVLLSLVIQSHAFDLVREYAGTQFFDKWDFYGSWDNLTLGDVWWLNRTDAISQHLAYVNSDNRAVLRVDNTSNVPWNEKRNTVRITTRDSYDFGSLWVIDLVHIPYGCSVWPAFWAKGPTWPDNGEIDIIEAINLFDHNQMAIHTLDGCYQPVGVAQTGRASELNCSSPAGCVVAETKPNSYGPGFAAAGGGVWACQFDVSGIYMWFWSRPDVPASLTSPSSIKSVDISQWGTPSAAYLNTNTCNLTEFYTPQQLVLDITLCGDWAGVQDIYAPQCYGSGPNGSCYLNNVIGPGSPTYDNAYFEINYVRAYTTPVPTPTAAPTSNTLLPASPTDTGDSTTQDPTAIVTSVDPSPTTSRSAALPAGQSVAHPFYIAALVAALTPILVLI